MGQQSATAKLRPRSTVLLVLEDNIIQQDNKNEKDKKKQLKPQHWQLHYITLQIFNVA